MGRYTHKVAISNARIISVEHDSVVFRTRGDQTARLPSAEFARRFLDHVLSVRFVKIRHFGLHASGNVNGRLERARALLTTESAPTQTPTALPPSPAVQDDAGMDPPSACRKRAELPWPQLLQALTNIDLQNCPACHKRAVIRVPLPQAPRPPPYTAGWS